jgi:hypothetical protein
MNNQFTPGLNKTNITNSNNTGMQFYNPPKDSNNPSLLYQHSQSSNTLNAANSLNNFKSSKGFNFKPTTGLTDNKNGTSSSTFLKSQN